MSIMTKINSLSAQEIMDMQDNGMVLFVRWSRGPKYDIKPSRDYANGGVHGGLSAVLIGHWEGAYMTRRLNEYMFLRMKDEKLKPYIYTGEVIGRDSDGYESIDVATANCVGVWDEVKLP